MKQQLIQLPKQKPKLILIKIFLNSTGAMCLVGSLYEGRANATGEYSLEYDENGNLISGFEKVYTYNDFNQLVSVNNSDGLLEEYVYDDSGNRIKKYNYETNTTTYYIDSSFIQVINSSGIYNETYYYDSRDLVAKKNNDGEISYYHPDHLGSTSLITNSSGDIVENTFYMPYGSILSGGSDRYDYEGKETDEGTDLQYFGARYYDSYTRVFTQPDSIIPDVYDPQQLNPYMFERGNPLSYVDESGHVIGEAIYTILETAIDVVSLIFSAISYAQDPESIVNKVSLTLDVIDILSGPFSNPGPSGIMYKTGSELFKKAEVKTTTQIGANILHEVESDIKNPKVKDKYESYQTDIQRKSIENWDYSRKDDFSYSFPEDISSFSSKSIIKNIAEEGQQKNINNFGNNIFI